MKLLVEKSFDTGEVVLNYAEGPDNGPPLVLLHGGGWGWRSFMPILPHLSLRWHIYALDARGHGKSGRTSGSYSLETLYKDVEFFVRERLAEPAVVFGHSQGAWLALMLAGKHPDTVRALIVGDTPLFLEGIFEICQGLREFTISLLSAKEGSGSVREIMPKLGDGPPTHGRRWMARWLSQLDAAMIEQWIKNSEDRVICSDYYGGYDPENLFKNMSCPVLLLQADASSGGMMTDEHVERASNILDEVVTVKLKDIGHGLYREKIDEVLLPVLNFLESLRT